MLARRLLGAVQQSVGAPFQPFPNALYATRTVSTVRRSDNSTYTVTLTNVVPVTYDGTIVTFGAPVTRAGMTRQIYGFPVRSSYAQVLLFGRDYVAAPVPPGTAFPAVQGPNLPGSVVALTYDQTRSPPAQATTTVTGTLTSPVVDGSARSAVGGGVRTGLSFLATQDNLYFGARTAALNALLAQGSFVAGTVAVTTSQGTDTMAFDGTMSAGLVSSTKSPTAYTIVKLLVNGVDVTAQGKAYPATYWFKLASGSNRFTGSATSGPHSVNWTYATTWTTVRISDARTSGSYWVSEIYPSTPTPTSAGGEYMTAGSTQQTAQYALALPQAPTVVRDDPVTVGLYPLTQTCTAAPSSTAVATAYAETSQQYDGYLPIQAGTDGTIPSTLPKDGTTASVPWYLPTDAAQGSGTPQSRAFALPTGQLVQAATARVAEFQTGSGFNPYRQTTVLGAGDNAQPQVTDTYGTCLATVVTGTTGSIKVVDFFNAVSYTLTVDSLTATVNTGDSLLFLSAGASYPCLPTTGTIDAFVAAGAAGSITYSVDPTRLFSAVAKAFLWTSEQTPRKVTLTGLPGTGVDPLFDSPTAGAVGRDLAMTSTPVRLGTRNGVLYLACTFATIADDVVPIAQAGGAAGTTTYQGSRVVRVGIMRVTRTVSAIVAVKGVVATVLPYYGTRAVTYWDLGQLVDGSGAPTGTYVSWQSPGQAWSRGSTTGFSSANPIAYGPSSTFGQRVSPTAVLNVANLDYAMAGMAAIDLAATMANPGASGNVKTVTPPSGFSGSTVHLPHLSAILLLPDSRSSVTSPQLSTDLGATWQAVAVTGIPVMPTAGEYPSSWPGQPLFAF